MTASGTHRLDLPQRLLEFGLSAVAGQFGGFSHVVFYEVEPDEIKGNGLWINVLAARGNRSARHPGLQW